MRGRPALNGLGIRFLLALVLEWGSQNTSVQLRLRMVRMAGWLFGKP